MRVRSARVAVAPLVTLVTLAALTTLAALAASACGSSEAPRDASVDGQDASSATVDVPDADAGGPDGDVDAGGDAGPCGDPSLVLCMRFDGDLYEEAHGLIAALEGSFSFIPGIQDRAVVLGPSNTIRFADGPAWTYAALTVEAWVRVDAMPDAGGRAGILDKNNSFGLFVSDGIFRCTMGAAVTTPAAPVGQWVHVACVTDNATTRIYLDGVEKASVPAIPIPLTNEIGAVGGNSPSGDPLTGALDLLRVYARPKSAEEIAADAKR